jgi:hypothetical protein
MKRMRSHPPGTAALGATSAPGARADDRGGAQVLSRCGRRLRAAALAVLCALACAGLSASAQETLTSITATTASGYYTTGAAITIIAAFSGPITVDTTNGIPTLNLSNNLVATYSGSTATTVAFLYTVSAGDVSNGLLDVVDKVGSTPIALNLGGINNTSNGNPATLTFTLPNANSITSTRAIVIDAVAPTVVSSTLLDASPTNAGTVDFLLTFSEAITGLDLASAGSNLSLLVTGLTGTPAITAVAPVGPSSYDVTVSTGSGAGTIQLQVLSASTTIADLAGNALTTSYLGGQTYAVDLTAPTATITLLDPTPSSAAFVRFQVAFDKPVTGVDLTSGAGNADFSAVATALSGAVISSVVAVDAATYTVTLSTGSATGGAATLGLNIKSNLGSLIADALGNPFGNAGVTGPTYAINLLPQLYLGGGTTTDVTTTTYNAAAGQLIIAAQAAIVSEPANCSSFTATLTNRPDGSSEQLNCNVGTSGLSVTWSNVTGTLTLTGTASALLNYQPVIETLYYVNSSANPTAGDRVITCTLVDASSARSPTAQATVPVVAAVAALSLTLTGNTAIPNETVSYVQGSGALAIASSSTIANTLPGWVPVYDSSNGLYVPPYIFQMIGVEDYTLNFSEGDGTFIDAIGISVANPSPTGFGSVEPGTPGADETISFAPIVGYPPDFFTGGDPSGAYWQYDGNAIDCVYSPVGLYNSGTAIDMEPPANPTLGTLDFATAISSSPVVIQGLQNAAQLAIPLNAVGTPLPNGDAITMLQSLLYTNTSNNPSRYGFQREVTVSVTQGGVTSSAVLTIDIVPVNNPPVVSGPASYAVNEGDAQNTYVLKLSTAGSGLAVSDIDGNGFNETLTLSVSHGTLAIANSGGLASAVLSNGNATLTLTGSVDGANGNLTKAIAKAGNITYTPTSLYRGPDALTATINDNGHASVGFASPLSTQIVIPITVTAVDQPPAVAVPATQNAVEDSPLTIAGMAVSDIDAGGNPVQLTLSAANGTLVLAQTTNLTVAFSDGNGTGSPATLAALAAANATMTFRGSISDINNAIKSLTYQGNQYFYGTDTITAQVSDLGNTGIIVAGTYPSGVSMGPGGNSWINSQSFQVNVAFVNTVPIILPNGPTAPAQNPNTQNLPVTVPANGTVTIQGGSGVYPTYPLLAQRRNAQFTPTAPANAGTTVVLGGPVASNLVAWDEETVDPRGLTYVIQLGVSQGLLIRHRPGDPPAGLQIVAVPQGATQVNSFTQDDLNLGYVTYTQNGALSGNDGFVFTVTDDNALSYPTGAPAGAPGISTPTVFNIIVNRSRPTVSLSALTPTFIQAVPPAAAVPIIIDGSIAVTNSSDPNTPPQFAPAGLTGANLSIALSIPVATQVPVNAPPAPASGDGLDALGLQASTFIQLGPVDPTTGAAPLSYNGTPIGAVSGGQAGAPLLISLESAAPILVSTVADLLQHVSFVNASENPSASPRLATFVIQNGSGVQSVPVGKPITVVPVDIGPSLTAVRKLLAVPNVAVPFSVTTGVPGDATVATVSDPDGVAAISVSVPPINGIVTATAVPGVFTYTASTPTASVTGISTDQFTIIATDSGLPSDPTAVQSPPLVINVVITDVGANAPVIDSNPPFEVAQGSPLSYTPHVTTAALGNLGLPASLSFSLVDPGLTTPALSFSAGAAGDGTITWPAGWSVAAATGLEAGIVYLRLGIVVNDLANQTAAYQAILLRIVQPPTGND